MRRVREDRRAMGPSSDLPNLRRDAVLRQFAEQARHQTRARERPCGHRFGSARRALVVLLSRRRVRPVLDIARSEVTGRRKPDWVYNWKCPILETLRMARRLPRKSSTNKP